KLSCTKKENYWVMKEFILLGLTQQPELQLPLFFLFLGIYVVSMVGNLGLVVLIVLNPHLHTPISDCFELSPAHPNVLFSLQPLFHRSLLLLCHNPQNAAFFCWMFITLAGAWPCPLMNCFCYSKGTGASAFIVSEFTLMGLTDQPELQLPLFVLFLVNYTVTVMGNLSLMSLIFLNSNLHTPMYYFIFNLSFIDFCYSFVFTPKMLMSFVLEKNTISFRGCMTQLFFFCFFVNSESYVLTAMAYDRYVAICQPLLYKVVMSPGVCFMLMFASYLMGFAGAMAHTGCMIRLSFCDSNIIDHYMCDIFPLLQLSCSSIYVNELVSFIVVGTVITLSSLIILVSYAMILSNIIHMSSGKSWSKAMGTCGSHIITVSLFYGSGLLAYVKPSSAETVGQAVTWRRMALGNDSSVKEFILMGLTQRSELQLPLFFFFLGIYVVSMVGNLGLIVLIAFNPHLHTPMYYFLFHLSFTDLCYSSVITPKMLVSFMRQNILSHAECMTQLFFFCFLVIDECYILTAMAYDRYAAICKPLLYQVIMSYQVCHLMMVGAYMMGFVGSMAHVVCMLRLTFCDGNIINHYICDILPLLKLSCTSTAINELVVYIVVGVNVIVPSLTIFISYALILSNILGIHSAEGRSKAFSTCGSHVIAVSFFFGAAAFNYFKPSSASEDADKVSTIFYTIVGPMLNPLIYSIRNKDVHIALRKTLKKCIFT
ncbi:olfactory receptor 145-like, partial [Sigmodon hispidus]